MAFAIASLVILAFQAVILLWSTRPGGAVAISDNLPPGGPPKTFYQQTAVDIRGNEIEMEQFREKVVLVVNVASECGYTASNYQWLHRLQTRYGRRGLAIVLMPCNQFGGQEPASDREVHNYISRQDLGDAVVLRKGDVHGDDAAPLYSFLEHRTGRTPAWNFAKYLVDAKGGRVHFYATGEPLEMVEDVLRQWLRIRTNHTDL